MFANKTLLSIGRLNHVAIAVGNLENAVKLYRETLGAKVSEPVVNNLKIVCNFFQAQVEHGVTTVFVDLGNTKIELLHPLGEKSPIKNFLDKKPEGGVHHICIEVLKRSHYSQGCRLMILN